jgi:hypothetical protein
VLYARLRGSSWPLIVALWLLAIPGPDSSTRFCSRRFRGWRGRGSGVIVLIAVFVAEIIFTLHELAYGSWPWKREMSAVER